MSGLSGAMLTELKGYHGSSSLSGVREGFYNWDRAKRDGHRYTPFDECMSWRCMYTRYLSRSTWPTRLDYSLVQMCRPRLRCMKVGVRRSEPERVVVVAGLFKLKSKLPVTCQCHLSET